jgi:hypothetical protein
MPPRPFLLLDIDGPLNPYRAKVVPPGYDFHEFQEGDKTWKLLLNQQHGIELNALAEIFELAWATSWEHGANRLIAPRLGLPSDLAVIVWPPDPRQPPRKGSWKTPHIAAWVGDRPFVWIDDEVNRYDRFFLEAVEGIGPHLLHRVEPNIGLSSADFAAIRLWAEGNNF